MRLRGFEVSLAFELNGNSYIESASNSKDELKVKFLPRVIHFEVDAKTPERVIAFYEQVFGWKIEKWKGPREYWLITTGKKNEPGIDGGLSKRTENQPSTVNTIEVKSVDNFLKKIKKNGGKIIRPKMPIPKMGWLAYFMDPEGNTWGIMEPDRLAK